MNELLEQDAIDAKEVAQYPRYMIRQAGPVTSSTLYWSRDDGWVHYAEGDTYFDTDVEHMRLPEGGEWAKLDESQRFVVESEINLKEVLAASFRQQVHEHVAGMGFLVEQEWRPAGCVAGRIVFKGPVLVIRAVAQVKEDQGTIAKELCEVIAGAVPESVKHQVKVWSRTPRWDRWNEQWSFECVIAAAPRKLLEAVEGEDDFKDLHVATVTPDFEKPEGLSPQGEQAWKIIIKLLLDQGDLRSGGHKRVFASPEEWTAKGYTCGQGSELVVIHDGGDHAPYFNTIFGSTYMHTKMNLALRRAGLRAEPCENWYSAVFQAEPDDGEIDAIETWLKSRTPTAPVAEAEDDDLKELSEPTNPSERISELMDAHDLHVQSVITKPAQPGWGDLGREGFIIKTSLQPYRIRPAATAELAKFCEEIKRDLEHVTGGSVHFTTNYSNYFGAWEITWTVNKHMIESQDDAESELAKDVGHIPPDRETMPSGVEGWQDRLHSVYKDYEEFEVYSELYGLAERLGFQSAEDAWRANPIVRGSTNPVDYGMVESARTPEGTESAETTPREGEHADKVADILNAVIQEENEDDFKEVWLNSPHSTHMFKLGFDFGAGEGTRELVFAVPAELLPPIWEAGDITEIENFVRQYARQTLTDVPKDDWDWLVSVEAANPERLLSELHGLGETVISEDAAVDAEAAKTEEPSEAQKEAGNYKKGHVRLWGFDISIENAKGSERSGKDKGGKEWSVTMPAHYGYIKGTEGKDKDHVDVYIGPNSDGEKVFVVNQDTKEGSFDEHKVMLGFDERQVAIDTYDKAYSGDLGKQLRGSVISTTIDEFKEWLQSGDKKKPFPEKVGESSEVPAWKRAFLADWRKALREEAEGDEWKETTDLSNEWELTHEERGLKHWHHPQTGMLLVVRRDGETLHSFNHYAFSLSMPGSVVNFANMDVPEAEADRRAMEWASHDPTFAWAKANGHHYSSGEEE